MPRKVFESFTRLDASDVNTFLMDQSVMSFAGTAARGSAIGTATEGMVTYLNDINSLSVNNGTAWTTDRTIQVFGGTAARGSAISSPVKGMVSYLDDINSLSVNNGTAWTTDRTIQVFAGTAARGSAIGTAVEGMYAHLNDTDTLTYYNGSAWVAAGGGGAILQVVSDVKTDPQVSASIGAGTTVDITGLSVSITPSSASSKILLLAQVNGVGSVNGIYVGFEFVRDSTQIGKGDNEGNRVGMTAGGSIGFSANNYGNMTTHMSFLDSPATTSAITYKVRLRNAASGTQTLYVNRNIDDSNLLWDTFRSICTITAMEVAA
jgi:hypothetical protein